MSTISRDDRNREVPDDSLTRHNGDGSWRLCGSEEPCVGYTGGWLVRNGINPHWPNQTAAS